MPSESQVRSAITPRRSGASSRRSIGAIGNTWSIAHTSGTDLAAHYHRLARRCGKRKAIVALAHKLLVIVSHLLRDRRPYQDLGAEYFERLDATRLQRRYVRGLAQLGYALTLTPATVA